MTRGIRKLLLTAHVTVSVGWLGAVASFLALAIAGLTSDEPRMVSAAYLAMNVTTRFVIVPLALASLLTGIVQSLATEWGLFRRYWVVTKLALTAFGTIVLLLKVPLIARMAALSTEASPLGEDLRQGKVELVVHSGGGLLLLLVAATLSVFKPWGKTRFGRSGSSEPRPSDRVALDGANLRESADVEIR